MATIFIRKKSKNVLSKKGIGSDEPYRPLRPEEKLQRRVFKEIINKNPLIYKCSFATKNEGKRNWKEGQLQKELGLIAGVPDIYIDYPTQTHHGLRLELKEKSPSTGRFGRPTKHQIEMINTLNALGYFAKICYGFDDVKQTIDHYLKDEI